MSRTSSMPEDPPPLPPSLCFRTPPLPPISTACGCFRTVSRSPNAASEMPPPLLPRTAKSYAPKLPYRPPSPYLKSRPDSEFSNASTDSRRPTSTASTVSDSCPSPKMTPRASHIPNTVRSPPSRSYEEIDCLKQVLAAPLPPPKPQSLSRCMQPSVETEGRQSHPKVNDNDAGEDSDYISPSTLPTSNLDSCKVFEKSSKVKNPPSAPSQMSPALSAVFPEQSTRPLPIQPPKPAPKPALLKDSKPKLPVKPKQVSKGDSSQQVGRCAEANEKPPGVVLAIANALTVQHQQFGSQSPDESLSSVKSTTKHRVPVTGSGTLKKESLFASATDATQPNRHGAGRMQFRETSNSGEVSAIGSAVYSAIEDFPTDTCGEQKLLSSPAKHSTDCQTSSFTVVVDRSRSASLIPTDCERNPLNRASNSPPSPSSSTDSNRSPRARRKPRPNIPPPPKPKSETYSQTIDNGKGKCSIFFPVPCTVLP